MGEIAEEIGRRLHEALRPTHLEVRDDSAQHAGHAGHDPRGESHFTVVIESEAFAGMNRVGRQRLVNQALAELLAARVHALSISATAPADA